MDVNAETNAPQIDLTIEPRVPVWVRGDPHPLRRILFNLISNAVKYGRDSTVHITVRCMAAQKADGKNILECCVADEGQEFLEKAGTKFLKNLCGSMKFQMMPPASGSGWRLLNGWSHLPRIESVWKWIVSREGYLARSKHRISQL